MNAREEYRYNRLTWAELDEAIALQKVVILPTGSTEQHGRHLPLDVDVFLVDFVDEIKAWPIEKRSDQHRGPVQSQIRW